VLLFPSLPHQVSFVHSEEGHLGVDVELLVNSGFVLNADCERSGRIERLEVEMQDGPWFDMIM
jgi:hypothetical protein